MRIRGYVRLSDLRFAADLTPEEREEAETGLDRQAEDIRQYARTGGHTVERIVEEAGNAFSSRVRPRFEEELEALKDDGADVLFLGWKLDRMLRKPGDLDRMLDAAKEGGARVASVREGFLDDPLNPLAGFLALVAKMESANTSVRVARMHESRAAAAKGHVGGRRPYGHSADRSELVEQEAAVVRDIAGRFLDGENLVAITRRLNDEGIPTAADNPWRVHSVRALLGQARLCGGRDYRGQVIFPDPAKEGEPPIPSIISREDFDQVQVILNGRKRGKGRAPKKLLSGILRCGLCGTRLSSKPNRGVAAYWCPKPPVGRGCGRIVVDGRKINALVQRVIIARLDSPNFARLLAEGGRGTAQHRRDVAELEEARVRLDRLDVGWHTGGLRISLAAYEESRRVLEEQIERLEGRVLRDTTGPVVARLAGKARKQWPTLTDDQRRAVIEAVCESIKVNPAPLMNQAATRGNPFVPERVAFAFRS